MASESSDPLKEKVLFDRVSLKKKAKKKQMDELRRREAEVRRAVMAAKIAVDLDKVRRRCRCRRRCRRARHRYRRARPRRRHCRRRRLMRARNSLCVCCERSCLIARSKCCIHLARCVCAESDDGAADCVNGSRNDGTNVFDPEAWAFVKHIRYATVSIFVNQTPAARAPG